jgi:hypothetical protein
VSFCGPFFLVVSLTQLTGVLHSGFWVSCHGVRSPYLRSDGRFNPGRSWLFVSESEALLVDSLYAEAIDDVKLRTALSASSFELISILGDIKSEARL